MELTTTKRVPRMSRLVLAMLRNQARGIADCEQCTYNHWKTRRKGAAWQCRMCGSLRGKGTA